MPRSSLIAKEGPGDEPLKVAIFPSAFYPSLGGVEELVRQLAQQLKRDGNNVMIATNRWPKSIPQRETVDGLDVYRYICRVPERTWKQLGGAILYGPSTLRSICSDLREFGAELLHIQCVSSSGYYALRAARKLGLPLVVTLQGEITMDASGIFQRSQFAAGLMRDVLDHATRITACSAHTLAEGEAFYGKSFGNRGVAIPNGVLCADFEAIPYAHRRPYVFALGRHAKQKGFDNLLRSFAAMNSALEEKERYDLLLAGDGPERASLENLTTELRLGDSVQFIGRKTHEEAVALFLGCAFFVLSSRAHEGLPVVSVEALAAGAPIVATSSGGTPEAVKDGVNGIIVPRDDVDALTSAMIEVARNKPLRDRMRAANPVRAREYDWSAVAEMYSRVYREALEAACTANSR